MNISQQRSVKKAGLKKFLQKLSTPEKRISSGEGTLKQNLFYEQLQYEAKIRMYPNSNQTPPANEWERGSGLLKRNFHGQSHNLGHVKISNHREKQALVLEIRLGGERLRMNQQNSWKGDADVIVVGGGSAGVSAAIAAGRLGKSVILIERYPFLGGTATAAMVGPTATFHSAKGEQIIGGIPEEIVQELVRRGGSLGHVKDTIGVCGSLTPIEPEMMKLVLLEFAKKAGVKMLFHGLVYEVKKNKNRINQVKVMTKNGVVTLEGKVFIDASGDGDVAAYAGAPFTIGEKGLPPQPMTLIFKLGHVKLQETIQYILAHREEFYEKTLFNELTTAPAIGVSGFYSFWKEATKKQEVHIPRDRVLFFSGVRPGEVTVNTTRIINKNPLNPWELSQAEEEGREQVIALLHFFRKYIPGFQESVLVQAATQVGIRESRRIQGEYTLTSKDVLQGRQFEDGIAKCGYPIDIHDPTGKGIVLKDIGGDGSYDIPYQCLIPLKIENLLIAGRCISATHEALGSCRIQATAMAVGQAAGTAAALSLQSGGEVRKVRTDELRKQLTEMKAIL